MVDLVANQQVIALGVIGGGRGGMQLFEFFDSSHLAKIRFVVDTNVSAPAMLAAKAKQISVYTDFEQALSREKVDFVIETTGIHGFDERLAERLVGTQTGILTHGMAGLMIQVMAEHRQQTQDEVSNVVHPIKEGLAAGLRGGSDGQVRGGRPGADPGDRRRERQHCSGLHPNRIDPGHAQVAAQNLIRSARMAVGEQGSPSRIKVEPCLATSWRSRRSSSKMAWGSLAPLMRSVPHMRFSAAGCATWASLARSASSTRAFLRTSPIQPICALRRGRSSRPWARISSHTTRFPMREVAEAHLLLESRATRGALCLLPYCADWSQTRVGLARPSTIVGT